MSTLQSIAREALAFDPESDYVNDPRTLLVRGAGSALRAIAELDRQEGRLLEVAKLVSAAHVHAFYLLAENPQGLTHAQLFAHWLAKSARVKESWPWISESGARSRVAELKGWGVVEPAGREGRTAANRPTQVWQLSADFHWKPPAFTPEALAAISALELESGTNVVTGALLARLAAVEVAR